MTLRAGGDSLNIASGIREFAVATPDRIAVSDNRGVELTFSALNERATRLGNVLMARGLRSGDPIAVLLSNTVEFAVVWAGLGKVWMPVVPIHPRASPLEARNILERSGARALILEGQFADIVGDAVTDLGLAAILELGGTNLGAPLEDAVERVSAIDAGLSMPETGACAILYTSGTTGRPKGVLISHRARTLMAYCGSLEWGWGRGKVNGGVVPMGTGGGFTFSFGALQTGGQLHIMDRFDPEKLLAAVEQRRICSIFLVPTHVQLMREVGEDRLRSFDTSSLKVICLNAAPIRHELKEWLIATLPHTDIHELYGSTEAGIVTNLRPEDQIRKKNSVGPPWFLTQVKILDEEGADVVVGEIGELFSRSPFLFDGYLNDSEKTADAVTQDGFVSVGDLASRDEENYISIVGRKKEMIITGGMNVYPREVEDAILEHPNVDDAAVVGLPDDKWGEAVTAVVVPVRGASIDPETLIDFCRDRLATYKLPREVLLRDDLPRNSLEKIMKTQLCEELLQTTERTSRGGGSGT